MTARPKLQPLTRAFRDFLAVATVAGCLSVSNDLTAAIVQVDLTGANATGALNLVGFDNEINEPNVTPPSREHAFEGNGSSHGFPYFRYTYHPDNPDAFNDYAGLWSIIVSSHTVASLPYYASVLQKAGAVEYADLNVSTLVERQNSGAFNVGSLSYESTLVPQTGTKVLAPGQFSLAITRDDYNFNVLNESTAPGTWTGYPYYYWGVDNYTLTLGNITGQGLKFVGGALTSMDFVAAVKITSVFAPNVTWDGTLTLDGGRFTYDINESEFIPGFGDMHIVMDRTGIILVPEPAAVLLLGLGSAAFALRRRRSCVSPNHITQ